jgi:NTP pyrophosphatase (non-canonical NTP hydrolase)
MAEELGEISACVTKGKSKQDLAEESADLLILLMGTALSAEFDLNTAIGLAGRPGEIFCYN